MTCREARVLVKDVADGNLFPARKAIPGLRTHDVMAGFLTYRLMRWPPSRISSGGNVTAALGLQLRV